MRPGPRRKWPNNLPPQSSFPDVSDDDDVSRRDQSTSQKHASAPTPDAGELLRRLAAAEAEAEKLRRQLEHADRLASLGTLAATIAHEFNNILTPSMSYAQLALGSIERGQPDLVLAQKALSKCQSAGRKAGRICEAIMNFARPGGEGEAQEAELTAVVEEALATLGHDPAKDGIMVRLDVAPDLRAAIDPLHLEHVVVNLLLNARQAMLGRRRGTLSIMARPHSGGSGPAIRMEVSDTGCGIDQAHLPHVFDTFFTTRDEAGPSGRGTGLGLSLCRQIIERCGGQISVQSTVGRGTTFCIVLPAQTGQTKQRVAA